MTPDEQKEALRLEVEEIRRTLADPRRAVVRDIMARISVPRFYCGDWAGDMADRILKAIDTASGSGVV